MARQPFTATNTTGIAGIPSTMNKKPSHHATKRRRRNVVVDFGVYLFVRMLLCVIQALPESACLRIVDALVWVFCDLLRFRASVIEDNLRHAFPDSDAATRKSIARGMWQHLMVLVCEIARAHRKIHQTNWRKHVQFEGCRELVGHQLTGRGLVIVTAHFGNFEISGYVAGLLGMPNFTVARPLDNPFLQAFMVRFRESTGQSIVSSRGSAEVVDRLVQQGQSLAILGDHYGGPKGSWVNFFGRPASCHKSIALLSLNYNVPLLVFNTQRVGPMLKFRMKANTEVFDPATTRKKFTVRDLTQWFTTCIEEQIRSCPSQYWWLHRRWKDNREEMRQARRESRAKSRCADETPPTESQPGAGPKEMIHPVSLESIKTSGPSTASIHSVGKQPTPMAASSASADPSAQSTRI